MLRLLGPFVLVALLLPFVLSPSASGRPAANGTHVSGTISTNTTWTSAGSPYVLDGNVTVASGVTLTVNPGVVVKFNGQFRTLVVNGTLSAIGTAGSRITFTSIQDDTVGGDSNGDGSATSGAPGQWSDIKFNSNTSQLSYVDVRYGGYGTAQSYAPIYVYGSGKALTIDHALISQNQKSGVVVGNRAAVTISDSTIEQNTYGIYNSQGTLTLERTTVSGNSARGIWFNLPNSTPLPAASSIMRSDVKNNTTQGIYILANGDYPLASMPHGNWNNIFANNGGGIQLDVVGYPSFANAEVDWKHNYWGADVGYAKNRSECSGVSPKADGDVVYRSSGSDPKAGPFDNGRYYLVGTTKCAVDFFKLGPLELEPTEIANGARLASTMLLGDCGGDANLKQVCVFIADPVNSATGNFAHEVTDASLPGAGVPFSFTRTYNSLDLQGGPFGPGWTHNQLASLQIKAWGDVTFRDEGGAQLDYEKQADGSFQTPAGALSTLAPVTGGYEVTRQDQVTYRFDTSGRLLSVKDRNNQGLSYAYDGSGRLATITDAAGRQATLSYNAANLISQLALADGRSVAYAYTDGRLSSVTDLAGKVWTYAYESKGLLEQETDPRGNTVFRNVYTADGRVAEQYDALNNKTSFAWDPAAQTQTVTDARNNVWKDVYASNVLQSRIDALNNQTQFGHNTAVDQTSVTGPDGTTVNMTYDAKGNVLTASVPALDATKTFSYDAQNNPTSVTDARGTLTTYGYDANGNTTSIVQDGTTVASYTYNPSGQPLTLTDGRNNTTTYTYETNGNLASETDPLGNKTTYAYDSAGRMTSKVTPRGNVQGADPNQYRWTYTYDTAGRPLTETDPLGNTTTYAYDDAGNQTSVTDPRGNVTTTAYDAANRPTSVTAPDAGGTSYTYDTVGNKLTETDPRGKTTTSTYDADNRLASMTTPLGNKTTYAYDASSNLIRQFEPRGNVQGADPDDYDTLYTYDAAGRLLTETDPLGNTTTYVYDKVGNRTSVTDANSHTTTYAYDGKNRLTSVTAPGEAVTAYTYDANGNLLTRTDPNDHVTSYAYDAANRLTSMTLPLSRQWTYAYDADGNRISQVDANGNATPTPGDGTTSYTYDRAGRLSAIDYSDSTPDVTFTYDAAGNRTQTTDGAGTQTYAYDNVNRLASVTRAADTFSYVYDLAGNITRRTYPDATVVDYGYDDDSRLASVTSAGQTTSYAYDPAGNLTQTTLPATNGYAEERTYDRAGRLTRVKSVKGASALADFTYTLDPVANPTQVVRAGSLPGTQTYEYDVRDRLTQVCYAASCPASDYIRWTYDPVGNRLTEVRPSDTTNYTNNAADELTQAGPTSYSYDQNGNETAAGGRTFAYDLEDRLTSTTASGETTTYSYDGDGKRLQATTSGQALKFLWDTNHDLPQLALERDGAGALVRRYLYGNARVALTTPGAIFYYHYDTLGSVANVTSAAGTTQWTYAYEPFGAARTEVQDDSSAPQNSLKFAGEYMDPTGLYHLRARQLDPALGRFLTRDPVDLSVSEPYLGAHLYAADRPTLLVDPSGKTLAFYDDAQASADEATSNCNEATTASDRIRCSYGFLKNRFILAKAQNTKIMFPKKYSAGLVGNFWAETERRPLDPTYDEEGGGPGRGIAQWTEAGPGEKANRWDRLVAWARRAGLGERELQTQLKYVWRELHTSERPAFEAIIATTTVREAAIAVQDKYERADPARQQKRIDHSLYIFRNY